MRWEAPQSDRTPGGSIPIPGIFFLARGLINRFPVSRGSDVQASHRLLRLCDGLVVIFQQSGVNAPGLCEGGEEVMGANTRCHQDGVTHAQTATAGGCEVNACARPTLNLYSNYT